jgi:hypothetical protein
MSSQMSCLWGALCTAYEALAFDSVTQGDTVFRDLVVARIIEPTSEADSLRSCRSWVSPRRPMPR